MQSPQIKNKNSGFTLVEVMIATGLFVVIMTVGIGLLLEVNRSHKLQARMRATLDTLSDTMEDMARNIRVGTNLHCSNDLSDVTAPVDCIPIGTTSQGSSTLALEGLNGDPNTPDDQIIYKIDHVGTGQVYGLYKKSRSDAFGTWRQITPDLVEINVLESGFSVTGSKLDDKIQPHTIIRLAGQVRFQNISIPFSIQTSVTQRTQETIIP